MISASVLNIGPVGNSIRRDFFDVSNAITGESPSSSHPDIPSLLRKENRRYLMDRIDTTRKPDFNSLTDIAFDHDIFVATSMISFDSIIGMRFGGRGISAEYVNEIKFLDEAVDIAELYRATMYDQVRYGNGLLWNRFEQDSKRRRMVDTNIIHPGMVVDMKMSPQNTPMWWVFKQLSSATGTVMDNAVFLDPKYEKEYDSSGNTGTVVGQASDIVHFKGQAPKYQAWGIGITQIAKILIEAKLDMLVDFSKIIKRESSPKEFVYVNTTGLTEDNRVSKINSTINSINKQRKLGSVIVLEMNEAEMKVIGSEGKVLDNFSLHYRDDILRAIRILTRIPPSFWLGEATNKATINSQLLVYNRYLESLRFPHTKKFVREVFGPYLKSNYNQNLLLMDVPQIVFTEVAIEDPTDRAMIDDMAVRNGTKSRKQVAEERGYRLPEEDGEVPPALGGGGFGASIIKERTRELDDMGTVKR
jgi:hypothetical protein